ncbi:MAG: exo-alpha-sialidase [Lentisphaeria bacterium]|nr:exo-alpha-sialidase [Lentisphaeria bacterium]
MKYVELRYQDPRTKTYLGSPSLVILPDGALLASHDYFNGIKNHNGESCLTSIYRSEDSGKTWKQITHIIGAFWMTMFTVGNSVYGIANTQEYGDVVIRRSDDGGFTWTTPEDENNGVLLRSGPKRVTPNYQITPGTTIIDNRIYLPLDDLQTYPGGPGWGPQFFHTCVLSAPVDADLLNPANWTLSNKVAFDGTKYNDPEFADAQSGWLEGNIVKAPDGTLANIIRMHLNTRDKAGYLTLSKDGTKLDFDYENGIIDFQSARSKFKIAQDPVSGLYITFCNKVVGDYKTIRNYLVMAASRDLRHWQHLTDVMKDDSHSDPEESKLKTGFQYVDWKFDGDDIIYLVRVSYDGANNYHDSNRIWFCRMENYAQYMKGML